METKNQTKTFGWGYKSGKTSPENSYKITVKNNIILLNKCTTLFIFPHGSDNKYQSLMLVYMYACMLQVKNILNWNRRENKVHSTRAKRDIDKNRPN